MRKKTVKGNIALLAIIATAMLLLSACKKPMPEARFDYSILDLDIGNYATCYLYNYSLESDTYEWTMYCPDGSIETSYSFEPIFRCYQVGTYKITLKAKNKYGTDFTSKSFYINPNGGGNENPTASAYTITWLRLEKIQMLDSDDSSWDTGLFGGANPDIKFQIQNSTNTTTYYTSSVKNDVSSSDFPVSWYNVNTTLEIGVEYRIRFLDEDSGLDNDDIMANCVWNLGSFYPGTSSLTWNSTDGTIKFTVGLSWIYGKTDGCEITQSVSDNETTDGNNIPIYPQQSN